MMTREERESERGAEESSSSRRQITRLRGRQAAHASGDRWVRAGGWAVATGCRRWRNSDHGLVQWGAVRRDLAGPSQSAQGTWGLPSNEHRGGN